MIRHGEDPGPTGDDPVLRRLMREGRHDGRPREEFRRRLGMMIDHNARHHRSRRGLLVVGLAAVVAVLCVVRLTDLGGNSFDLVRTGRTVGEGTVIFSAPLDGGSYGAGGAGSTDGGRAVLESFRELLATGEPADRIEGWTLRGHTLITGTYAAGSGMRTLRCTGAAAVADWLALREAGLADSLRARVDRGRAPVTHARLSRLDDGWMYFLDGHDMEFPGWGRVTYWRGEPAARR